MKNLEFAIINEFHRTRLMNEYGEASNEQFYIVDELCDKSWGLVTVEDVQSTINFEDEHISLYKSITIYIMEVLRINNLEFSDKRCYGYLIDGVFEMLRSIL